jgi:uncharacterized protein YdhG (YjbR/CyaY superfamily)
MTKGTARATTVEEYLLAVPAEERAALRDLRGIIQRAAPAASERIQYGMPTFHHQGLLVGFAAFEGHLGFYTMSPTVVGSFSTELRGFDVGKGCIRFRADRPLPSKLVSMIVRARLAEKARRPAE